MTLTVEAVKKALGDYWASRADIRDEGDAIHIENCWPDEAMDFLEPLFMASLELNVDASQVVNFTSWVGGSSYWGPSGSLCIQILKEIPETEKGNG